MLISASLAFGQTVRLKSNSDKHFKVTLTGVNRQGKEVTRTIDNVDKGYWKNISLYKTKYGYDLYNNKQMKREGADGTNRWKKIMITDIASSASDELDLTQDAEKKLPNTHLWVGVRITYDSDYQVTHLTFYDHRK